MALSLPYPNAPANGQALDASPIYANQNAIVAAIQSFDASQVQAGTLTAAAFATSINPNTILNETAFPFVVGGGCLWSLVSGLNGTMTSGTIYAPTPSSTLLRVSVPSIASHTFAASSDTYIDIDYNGNVTYSAVANNAASPALTANSVRVAIVITNGSTITSVNQGSSTATAPVISSVNLSVTDSLGNLIYPTDPNRKTLGYRQITANQTTTATSPAQVPGLSVPVIVPTGRKVTVSGYCVLLSATANVPIVSIWDGTVGSGTQLQQFDGPSGASNSGYAIAVTTTPASASKTYNLAFHASGAATTTINGNIVYPVFIKVELV